MNETPINYRGYRYYPDESMFKAKAIANATFLYPDSLYRRRRADQTLSRLMSLGTFRFVDIQFRPARNKPDSLQYGFLNSIVRMTQVPKKSHPGRGADERVQPALPGRAWWCSTATARPCAGPSSCSSTPRPRRRPARGRYRASPPRQYGIDAQLLVPRLMTPPLRLSACATPTSSPVPSSRRATSTCTAPSISSRTCSTWATATPGKPSSPTSSASSPSTCSTCA